jgi:hypothetical protein
METTESQGRTVAQLAGARLPADQGLAGLGLIMQLTGSTFLGFAAFMSMMPLFMGGHPSSWQVFLLGSLAVMRSAFHGAAGTSLIYGSPRGPFRGIKVYLGVALVQTFLTLLVLNQADTLTLKSVIGLASMLMAWPVALGVAITRPRFQAFADDAIPSSEDMGFEGAAVLMVLFGVIGVLMSALVLVVLFKLPGGALSSPHGLLFLGVFVMLMVRSGMHAQAGLKGTSGADADGASEAASRYYSFGVISAVIAGGALMIELMMTAMHPAGLLMVATVVYWLLVWPLILRRFFTERNFSVLLAGDEAPVYRRTPDAGLTSLGWLLLAMGVFGLASTLPTALFGASSGGSLDMFSDMFASSSSAWGRSDWWNVGVSLAQIWAAVELIGMTDRFKIASIAYGAIATVVTIYLYWPMIKMFDQLFSFGGLGGGGLSGGMGSLLPFLQIALALVIPIGTVLLIGRAGSHDAVARVRD